VRVTNQMMSAGILTNLNQLRSRQASLTDQITSGERITRASEDPIAGTDVMRLQSRTQVMGQWEANLISSRTWVRNTEAKLTDITDLLNKAKELALQGANGSMSTESRQAMGPAADNLLQDMLAALNDQEPEGALFAGFKTDVTPFAIDTATGIVTYSGDSGDMQRDVGPGITMAANVHGNRLVSLTGGWANSDNMLTVAWNLAEGLKTGDTARIQATIDKVNVAHQTVVALRSEMGARDMRIEQLSSRMTDMKVQIDDLMQQAQGVDVPKALMDLNSAEVTYRSALQVGARVLPPTLADFLR
jgi:flagellar hook-associated protein 3 FlgL